MKPTEKMIEAGLQHYSEGGCSGLADYERREVVEAILTAALAGLPGEPVAWRHEMKEPGIAETLVLLSSSDKNPWSHWVQKHLDQCSYSCTPLYAAPPAPAVPSQLVMDGVSKALVAMRLASAISAVSREYDFADAIAAAETAWKELQTKPAPAVVVKALEWQKVALVDNFNWLRIAQAETPFGLYTIDKHDKGYLRLMFNNRRVAHFDDDRRAELEAAAQADFDRRIRSALEVSK